MLHFIGWYWPVADQHAATRVLQQFNRLMDADPRWQLALKDDGVLSCVLCGRHDPAPLALHGAKGIIVGRLFKGGTPVSGTLDEHTTRRILDSRGEALVRDYWGNYVAIVKSSPGAITLIRGPASTVPVLRDSNGPVQRFFSSVEIPAALHPSTPTIDWPVFACSFIEPVASARTALRGVEELLPGYAEHLTPGSNQIEDVWKPLDLARQSPVASSAEAASLVRTTIETTTRASVAGHQQILHGLSGGLDSSVVLAALERTPERPEIVCVNYYSEDSEGDERTPAREAVQGTHAQLIEVPRREDIDLTRALGGVRTARPPGLRMPEVDLSEVELAGHIGASLLVKGHGGDEIFCRNLPIPAAADCLRSAAARPFFPLVLHAAVTEGVTFWQVLLQAASQAWLPQRDGQLLRSFVREHDATSLLNPSVIDLVLNDTAFGGGELAWRHSPPPGKRIQASLATGPRPYGTPHSRTDDVNLCTPLLSQPVIETALRIPTWLQFENRGERAVLRNAFADVLSPETVRRRNKGGAEILARRILNRNMGFIRELLLDGLLVRERIINRPRLIAALSDRPAPGSIATAPVFDLLGAEIWLRRWLRT